MGLFEQSSVGEAHRQQQPLHVLGAGRVVAAGARDQRSIKMFEVPIFLHYGRGLSIQMVLSVRRVAAHLGGGVRGWGVSPFLGLPHAESHRQQPHGQSVLQEHLKSPGLPSG